MDASPVELEGANHLVRHDAYDERIEVRRSARIARVGCENEPLAPRCREETERSRPDGDLPRLVGAVSRQDAEAGGVQEGREWFAQPHYDRRRIGRLDSRDHGERHALRGGERGIEHGRVRRLHVRGGDGPPIGEVKLRAETENDGRGIHELPRRGQLGNPPGRHIGPGEADVEEIGQPRAVGIGAETRVEALGLARQRHHEGAGGQLAVLAARAPPKNERQRDRTAGALIDYLRAALVPSATGT